MRLLALLPITTCLFYSEVTLPKTSKSKMRGDSSFLRLQADSLGMTDHLYNKYGDRGCLRRSRKHPLSHTQRIIVIPNEADEGGAMRNLPLIR